MTGSEGFSVHYPGLESIRQGLQDTSAGLIATVQDTQDSNTALADAIPALESSEVLNRLQAAHADTHHRYARELGGQTIQVQIASDTYQGAERATLGSVSLVGQEL
jgi:hypothetical protein